MGRFKTHEERQRLRMKKNEKRLAEAQAKVIFAAKTNAPKDTK